MLKVFNSNYDEIGSLNKNLVLNTLGKIKIRYGKKFIDLLDNNGNINSNLKIPIKKNSVSDIKSNGIYIVDKNIYIYSDGELIEISSSDNQGNYIKYDSELNLNYELILQSQQNIGLVFNSIDEAKKVIKKGIVFVGRKIYYINFDKIDEIPLNQPLSSINNSEIGLPNVNNSLIIWKDGKWLYIQLPDNDQSSEEFILNYPLDEINKTEFEELNSESDTLESNEIPTAIVYLNNKWLFVEVTPYDLYLREKHESETLGLPVGSIIMWGKSKSEIPEGWNICDGTNGTPNLIDKFIKASDTNGTTGGNSEITLDLELIPKHNHKIVGEYAKNADNSYEVFTPTTLNGDINLNNGGKHSDSHSLWNVNAYIYSDYTGNSKPINIEPSYYSLIYIMKIR